MQQFKIRKDGFKDIKIQVQRKTLPLIALAMVAGFGINWFNGSIENMSLVTGVIVIIVLAVTLYFGLSIGFRRAKALFESYTIILSDNLITREQKSVPTVSLYINEIKEINRNKNGSLTIKGTDPTDVIGVPLQLEEFHVFEQRLARIMPVTKPSYMPFLQQYQLLFVLVLLGSMFSVYALTNKFIVFISGVLVIVTLAWSIIEVRKSKHVDERMRRLIWFALLPLLSVAGVMIMKLLS